MSDNLYVAMLREAVAEYERLRDYVGGCTDGGCVVKRPRGMHTNGGCHCPRNHMTAQRMMYAGQRLHAAVIAALEAQASAPGGEVTEAEVEAALTAACATQSEQWPWEGASDSDIERDRRSMRAALTAVIAARTGKVEKKDG